MAASRSTAILRAALPHVPAHGFTLSAVLAGVRSDPGLLSAVRPSSNSSTSRSAHDTGDAEPLLAENALAALFPGPPTARTSVERTLFSAWDRDAGAQVFGAVPASPSHASGSKDADNASLGSKDSALQTPAHLLQERLALNEPVREHLLKAFALESAHPLPLPSLPSSLQAAVPLLRLLPSHPALPDPFPLLSRAGRIADEACRSAHTSRAWREGLDGPEWYLMRSRLAVAYLAGELHLLSPSNSLASSQDLLHRIANGPSVFKTLSKASSDLRSFIEWGGRSWIGILRSRGL